MHRFCELAYSTRGVNLVRILNLKIFVFFFKLPAVYRHPAHIRCGTKKYRQIICRCCFSTEHTKVGGTSLISSESAQLTTKPYILTLSVDMKLINNNVNFFFTCYHLLHKKMPTLYGFFLHLMY